MRHAVTMLYYKGMVDKMVCDEGLNKGRIKWIDIIKGICIVFVMLSHSYPPDDYRRFFTPFFLTMFFFASGYTFSTKNRFRDFILGKIYHLVCPVFLLGSIRIIGMRIMGVGNLMEGLKGLLLQISCQKDEMWFVSCLFTSCMLLYLLIRINRRVFHNLNHNILLLCEAILFLLLGYFIILILHWRIVWEFEIACIMLLYMVLGYIYKGKEVVYPKFVQGILFILYCAVLILIKNDVDIHAEVFPYPTVFIISSFLIVLPIIELSKWIEKTKMAQAFVFLGQNSLFYFAFSGFVREIFIRIIDSTMTMDPHIESLLCTLSMIVVLIIPAMITRKYFPWLVGVKKDRFI